MTLTDFLLARIAEDEEAANACRDWCECDECPAHPPVPRVLAECEAKRRIVTDFLRYEATNGMPQVEGARRGLSMALKSLALPYAAHPDYREEWRP